ncbi:TolC family protein [Clostridium sp. P21]|uniref:TolC family protein n=1 Tax=Clostridium muellerianum TaxID=2716538 RepID=A0A7Y0HQC1_9CLOT|nr:TolC family protein [Clostridium muellerianum]NMM65070.1 TolC family protein [Clostridium muellerianum]
MRKRLSLIITLAISLSLTTTAMAASVVTGISDSNGIVTSINISDLTLDQALNSVESNNIEVQSINNKIDSLNKKLDNDKRTVIGIESNGKSQVNYPAAQYAGIMIQKQVTPVEDQQSIDNAKNSKDEKINTIKFDIEKQYMNAITAKEQVDNINKNIADLNEQIKATQAKIDLGQLTKDSLNTLNVQKSKLLSQLATPYMQQQQAISNIKKYLNIDANSSLNLIPTKKQFVKFNDENIEDRIKEAVSRDYNLTSMQKSIDIKKIQVDIQTKYAFDSLTEPMNSKMDLEDLQNKSYDTNTNTSVNLWKAYYTLKNKEDAVQAQMTAQESAQLSYDKAKQSFDTGLIDKVSLDSAELALNTQKVATEQAVNDYVVVQEQLKYALDGHASTASSIQ